MLPNAAAELAYRHHALDQLPYIILSLAGFCNYRLGALLSPLVLGINAISPIELAQLAEEGLTLTKSGTSSSLIIFLSELNTACSLSNFGQLCLVHAQTAKAATTKFKDIHTLSLWLVGGWKFIKV